MNPIGVALGSLPVVAFGYAYLGYPMLLRGLASLRPRLRSLPDPAVWPYLTVTVPAYNAEKSIAAALDNLLAAEYPADRRQILVISDASTDGTDEVVRGYADRGVELLRMPQRRGKTAAENAAGRIARGDIVVNMDATVRIPALALKALVRAFSDPTVGVASSCDRSIGADEEANGAESGYVGYEMWVRELETRLGGIVGASGCFYGIRREIHDVHFPEELSRDFASALIAREHGFRSVSVPDAICFVPRTRSLDAEFERKIRTMARGLETLWFKRRLMNPFRYGGFALKLLSHKLCRWVVSLTLPVSVLGIAILASESLAGAALLGLVVAGIVAGSVGMRWSRRREAPRLVSTAGYVFASNLAGVLAWYRALRGRSTPVWEPTRRPV